MLAVTTSTHALVAIPKEEDTLSRGLHTSPLPGTHASVGVCWQHSRCCHLLSKSNTVSATPSCRTRTLTFSCRAGQADVEPRMADMPARSGCMFNVLQGKQLGYPRKRSRGEAFRSGEVRPLAADWPLRAVPQSLLRLEAPTSYHKLPPGPASRSPSRLCPAQPLLRRAYVSFDRTHPATDRQSLPSHRRWHRPLALRPLCRLPAPRPAPRRGRTVLR